MSISSALSNALSGLTANARAVSVVSDNLANMHTEGYGRREIGLMSNQHGSSGGVRVVGITRHVDAAVLGDRRMAQSELGHAETHTAFIAGIQSVIGTPDQVGSLSARITAFEASLITAASRPDAQDRLQAVSMRGFELAATFAGVSDDIQGRRQAAEGAIAVGVETVNAALEQVQDLNRQILSSRMRRGDTASLEDHRQIVIDRIAEYIPVREVPRDNGSIALMTPGGATLLDGSVARLGFERSNVIMPHMTLENGLLSGLTLNGEVVAASGGRSPLNGGRLSAFFEVRDALALDAQTQIDALARDMIERFQDSGVDTTLAMGQAGLFTDAGNVFAALDEVGIAARIELNPLVDLGQGGDLRRLRDGLGAAVPGPTGEAALLNAMAEALSSRRALASGDLGNGAGSVSAHVGSLASRLGQQQMTAEGAASFARASTVEMQERLLENGVDSDVETQRLLLIEQAYSANARMIQTLDEMMQTLLRI
ncbi:flagellar hook-associated protein FlgK [Roseovarius pelagicus]|uniref:Flagellar hook-associated protein 1 n=1 Tax=Roseovarius pelagicus TaxID=2980108 RepID=A0ABY6D807_9RHOB|nr:flagellar hook-associated protein FlgK [Roseovarius pelagicus]UXX82267.1 flagellar hook-associated protein FlgK [Roseovarius pelagicus]